MNFHQTIINSNIIQYYNKILYLHKNKFTLKQIYNLLPPNNKKEEFSFAFLEYKIYQKIV